MYNLYSEGLTDAPSSLIAEIVGDIVYISWTPPFTLDGINIPEYHIDIKAISDTGKEEISLVSLTTTSLFDATDNTNLSVFHICVRAETVAGLGQAACIDKIRAAGKID